MSTITSTSPKSAFDADQRNYEVSYEKIRKIGFETTVDLDRGISELVRRRQTDRVSEPVRQRLNFVSNDQ